jgi:hypothetical protein
MTDIDMLKELAWRVRLESARLCILLEKLGNSHLSLHLDNGWSVDLKRNEDGEQHRREQHGK